MRRRKILIIIGALLLVLGTFALFHSREPSYEGRTVTEWMEDYITNAFSGPQRRGNLLVYGEPIRDPAATNAFRQLGTNAVPYLLDWIDYEYPDWKNRVCKFVQTHNLKSAFAVSRRLSRPLRFAIDAPEIMRLLDPAAADAAVPGLAKLMRSPKPGVPGAARQALVRLGPKGLPPLIAGLSEGPTSTRIACASAICQMRTNAAPAVPALVRCLRDPDFAVRDFIRIVLDQVDADPALIISELTNNVADPKLRYKDCIQYLGSFRHAASNAVPALYLAMSDPRPEIRQAACFSFIRTVCNAHRDDGYEDLCGSPMRIALDRLNGDPAPMVAALTDIVGDPQLRNDSALECLASFGPAATNAVPVLLKAHRHSYDPNAQSNISNALERIAPSTLHLPFVSNAVHFEF